MSFYKKQFNSRSFSTSARLAHVNERENFLHDKNNNNINNSNNINNNILDPFFITGLTDAEGSFVCIIRKSTNTRLGWRVEVVFQIGLHKKDLKLLEAIKTYFNAGIISENKSEDMCAFRVSSPKQILEHILPHFDEYPLITQKSADFLLFKTIVQMMLNKEHLNEEGLQEIVNIRASLNLGLSNVLKSAFPDTIPVSRPLVTNQLYNKIPHPQWVAGFVTGEGCFFIKITKGRNTAGAGVQILFQVTQHVRDTELLKDFMSFFNCGQYVQISNKEWGYFQCTKFLDNFEKIIPFFNKYPIRGVKSKDFQYWVKVGEMIKNKEHLTSAGVSKIIEIKSAMNTGKEEDANN